MIVELSEANITVEKGTNMMGLATGSLEPEESYKRTRDKEVAKLWKELLNESALREEVWKTLEDER